MTIKACTKCRACDSYRLTYLFSLGEQYVSDFVPKDKIHSGHKVPITLLICDDCKLIQQLYTAPQDFLYTRHYWYRSGVTDTMRGYLADVVRSAMERVKLESGDVVLDIGSNDGTLLRSYPDNVGVLRVGVEPAKNLQDEGSIGVDFLVNDFWSIKAYTRGLVGIDTHGITPRAKIITACGMFYDLENPNQFIGDVAKALRPDGLFIAQLMCARQMYLMGDVGNLAHEHIEFYTLESLDKMLIKYGLRIVDVEENAVNGGSYRLYIRHIEHSEQPSERVAQAYKNEENLHYVSTWVQFYEEIMNQRNKCVHYIRNQLTIGKKIHILGASTKGNVILQFYGITNEMIQYASDRSPEKVGKYTIGTGIEIVSERKSREMNPDQYLLLPYAFTQEIIKRESIIRSAGCKFIVPLPSFTVI